jgi:hypothetical protein
VNACKIYDSTAKRVAALVKTEKIDSGKNPSDFVG